MSALHDAIENGNDSEVELLLADPDCDVNQYYTKAPHVLSRRDAPQREAATPLDLASRMAANYPLNKRYLAIFKMLASDPRVDLTLIPKHGRNALQIAASTGNIEVTEILLKRGMDPNGIEESNHVSGQHPMPPLHCAVEALRYRDRIINNHESLEDRRQRYGKVIHLLLEHGADVNKQDSKGQNILHVCASHAPYLMQMFLDEGADQNTTTAIQQIPSGEMFGGDTALMEALKNFRFFRDEDLRAIILHPATDYFIPNAEGHNAFELLDQLNWQLHNDRIAIATWTGMTIESYEELLKGLYRLMAHEVQARAAVEQFSHGGLIINSMGEHDNKACATVDKSAHSRLIETDSYKISYPRNETFVSGARRMNSSYLPKLAEQLQKAVPDGFAFDNIDEARTSLTVKCKTEDAKKLIARLQHAVPRPRATEQLTRNI